MGILGYTWTSMDIQGYLWISTDVHAYTRLSMDLHGYPWISMDIQKYPSEIAYRDSPRASHDPPESGKQGFHKQDSRTRISELRFRSKDSKDGVPKP